MFLILFLYAIIASTFIFAKKALIYASPLFLLTCRMLIAGICTLLLAYIKNERLNIKKKDISLFIQCGFFLIYLSFVPEFWALQYTSSFTTTLLYSLTPFITYIFEYILYNKPLSIKQVCATILGFSSLIPLCYYSQDKTPLYTQYGILPFISLLVAIISGSYAWFIVKKLINKNYSLFIINGYSMIIGGIGCLITFILFDQTTVYNNNYYLFLKWTSILVIISNIIAYNIYGYLLKYYSLTLISFVGFTCPLWSAIYEYIFYKRSFEINYWISFCIITVAILLFYSDEIHNNNRNNQDELYE